MAKKEAVSRDAQKMNSFQYFVYCVGKWFHRTIFPINKDELPKFVPSFCIFFILAYLHDMLRIIKSSIVVAQSHVGAEVIPYLKVWVLVPGAFSITWIAINLSRWFSREQIFYIMVSGFLLFYLVFIVAIQPHREALELTSLSQFLSYALPPGAQGFASMIRHWPTSLFYVVSEMWGSTLLSMLFWGFANEITTLKQAARFYPLFLLGANGAAIFAGLTSAAYANHSFNPQLPFGTNAWEQSLVFYVLTVLVGGCLVMGLFFWIHRNVDLNPRKDRAETPIGLTLSESFIRLGKSKHLFYIAILVVSYNLVFNLSDVMWENQLKLLYQEDTAGMARYKSYLTAVTGFLSVFISLFLSRNLLRYSGWKLAAMITPLVLFCSGLCFFFSLVMGKAGISPIHLLLPSDPTHLSLIIGSVQMCLSRGCKFSLFDTTKEIAFIPLSTPAKRYGKAVIDGVVSRLGKSLGSILVQIMLVIFSSLAAATPYIASITLIVLVCWLRAVVGLSRNDELNQKINP